MTRNKVYLGHYQGDPIYLSKHSWNCGWYWGFGYVGNQNWHFHINSMMSSDQPTEANMLFDSTKISDSDWWIMRDLFKQAYALKEAAATYRYGGHQTDRAAPLRVKSTDMAKFINADLEKLLDTIWSFVIEAVK